MLQMVSFPKDASQSFQVYERKCNEHASTLSMKISEHAKYVITCDNSIAY